MAAATQPIYYVNSPSHEGTPAGLSPTRSESGKAGAGRGGLSSEAMDEEEWLLGWKEEAPAVPLRWRYAVGFVVAFVLLFSFFSLVLWGASRAQKPIITIKSVRFEDFEVHAGTDISGVATAMVTMNATLKLVYRNTGTFFGVHVAPTPVNLFYKHLIVATGAIDRFYQRRKTQRAITLHLTATSLPVYGGGSDLTTKNGAPVLPVDLTLDFRVRSRAHVLGRLVNPKFYRSIHCPIIMLPNKMHSPLSLKTNCTYL